LRYPNLPLIDIGGQKSNLVPAELCEILPNQPFRGKLLDEHMAEMAKVACRSPNSNAVAIAHCGISEFGFGPTSDVLAVFGVTVGSEMAVVPGRILPPPSICYAQGGPHVNERAWWNLQEAKFATGGNLESWAVLLIKDSGEGEFSGPDDPKLAGTFLRFVDLCTNLGVHIPRKPKWILQTLLPTRSYADPLRQNAFTEIHKTLQNSPGKPQLLFVVLSNGDRHIYSGIKYLLDVHFDVQSICMQVDKFRKEPGQVQYFANMALKLNIKSGGVNHTLGPSNMPFLNRPIMLVGINIMHPGCAAPRGTPSIAAVVASVDKEFNQFPASVRIQKSNEEVRSSFQFFSFLFIPLLMTTYLR
jgi:eukaryotic translation initiation factor 2C